MSRMNLVWVGLNTTKSAPSPAAGGRLVWATTWQIRESRRMRWVRK
jgi:hypothetical protein